MHSGGKAISDEGVDVVEMMRQLRKGERWQRQEGGKKGEGLRGGV